MDPTLKILRYIHQFGVYKITLNELYDCFVEHFHLIDRNTVDANVFHVLVDLNDELESAAVFGFDESERIVRNRIINSARVLGFSDLDQLVSLRAEREFFDLKKRFKAGQLADIDMLNWLDRHFEDLSPQTQEMYQDFYIGVDSAVASHKGI